MNITNKVEEKTTKEEKIVDPLPKPTLMTPKEIDRKLLEQGMIECDCGAVVSELPFMDVMSGDDESKDAETKTTTRVRSQTWDSSLGPNEYQTILCYVKNFLAKAHPAVGRSGPVCPFVRCVRECYCLILLIRLELQKKTGTQKSSQGLPLHGCRSISEGSRGDEISCHRSCSKICLCF